MPLLYVRTCGDDQNGAQPRLFSLRRLVEPGDHDEMSGVAPMPHGNVCNVTFSPFTLRKAQPKFLILLVETKIKAL